MVLFSGPTSDGAYGICVMLAASLEEAKALALALDLDQSRLNKIALRLNQRPRKTLKCETPAD